jgi:hypothetical protein
MITISVYLIEITITLLISIFTIRYLRPFLIRILMDLCGNEDRAKFWTAFSNIVLGGLPLLIALTYKPQDLSPVGLFFEVAQRISGNLSGFLIGWVGVGFMVALFALFSPRSRETK